MLDSVLTGRYRIIQHLGEGGFCDAYLAEDNHLPDSHRCVVKRLKADPQNPDVLKATTRLFDSEAKILHQLGHHKQIPRLLAHFKENEEFYLVEEFIEGKSLSDELIPGTKFDETYVIELLQDILGVLKFVHQQQVIHRDIKPSNLIRRQEDGQLVLIDFGAVKKVTTQLINSANQTPHTILIGSPGYMPSEQFRGNPRLSSDVYAVGMIAIQALTGLCPSLEQLPEDQDTGEIVWRNHASVSPELASVLDKMVLYDYRQRYPSAVQALEAVHNLTGATKAVAPISSQTGSNSTAATTIFSDQTVSQNDPPRRWPAFLKTKAFAFGAFVFLLGSGMVSVASPHIQLVCTVLNNCSRDIQFQAVANGAKTNAIEAQAAAKSAKTQDSLKAAHDQLAAAINEMKTVPRDVKVHSVVQKVLPTFQTQLKGIKAKLSQEATANEMLEQAESIARTASQETENAKTITELEDSKDQWQTALAKLAEIPSDSFIASHADHKKKNYTQRVTKIDDQIETLVATTQKRQWQNAPDVIEPLSRVVPPVSQARQAPAPSSVAPAYVPAPAAPAPPAPAPAAPPAAVGGAAEPPPSSSQEPLWGPSADQAAEEPLW